MEQPFVVSARKYRPVTFDSVVGQSHITTTLKNAIRTQHLAQAFLFCGPRGVGKTTCARILAKTINCLRLDDAVEPCGECESCVAFQNNASLNIHELDAASNNSVEDIRNLIEQVRYPPQVGTRKVYIIDEVHMLSTSAFNAFLKTLEEPPAYAIFILATTEKHKILPTILSRCQVFDFNRIQIKDMADHLAAIAEKEGITADYEALELIAQKADGGLRDALSMFDLNVTFSKDRSLHYAEVLENLHVLDYDYYFGMTDLMLAGRLPQVLVLLDEILGKGFDGHQFLVGLLEHFRNLLVCRDAATVQLLQVASSVQKRYLQQAQAAPESFLLSALSVGSQADVNYKQSRQQRLHLEITLAKLTHLPELLNTAALPAGEIPEKKKPEPAADVAPVAVQEPPAPVATPAHAGRAGGRLRSTINLNEAPQQTGAGDALPEVVAGTRHFSEEEFREAWHAFIDMRRQEGTMSEVVMLDRAFQLDENVVHLGLDNAVQLQLLTELKTPLLSFLRKKLNNGQLEINPFIVEKEEARMPYTQAEKFQYLAHKNPNIQQLKEALGLDFDW